MLSVLTICRFLRLHVLNGNLYLLSTSSLGKFSSSLDSLQVLRSKSVTIFMCFIIQILSLSYENGLFSANSMPITWHFCYHCYLCRALKFDLWEHSIAYLFLGGSKQWNREYKCELFKEKKKKKSVLSCWLPSDVTSTTTK